MIKDYEIRIGRGAIASPGHLDLVLSKAGHLDVLTKTISFGRGCTERNDGASCQSKCKALSFLRCASPVW